MLENCDRPVFPKRAVITAGMPYGDKTLHLGHIGGVFIPADIFARFLRDRIGKENVIFVSGTDCYGSPIVERHRKLAADGSFTGDIQDFVRSNHERQREDLAAYHVALDIYAASSFGRASEIHRELCAGFFTLLHENGFLKKLSTPQFYDPEYRVFLNGRQVTGQCPIAGCASERGYADECSLGHQYSPRELLNPLSALSGRTPEMRNAVNWYFDLPGFRDELAEWIDGLASVPGCRSFAVKELTEFLGAPTIHVWKSGLEELLKIRDLLPEHTMEEGTNKSVRMVFDSLRKREEACALLTAYAIRYRSGKTLVPFRLTGNIEWGLPAPALEDEAPSTFWVWPESLWAPISFTAACLEGRGKSGGEWKDWWASPDCTVYQFIGVDNLFFYGLAEMAMFMAMGNECSIRPPELIVNNHVLFLDKKASSSGRIAAPMARELLNHYTAEQLRAHFESLGLGIRSVGFKPKPLDPNADEKAGDPVMKEGNLLCNVFNRAARTCFYSAQKYSNGKIPVGEIDSRVREESNRVILDFEKSMHRHEFHSAVSIADGYIRGITRLWEKRMRLFKESGDERIRTQALVDAFHMVRVASVLMHPIAPKGTELILEYLNLGEELWSWDRVFEPVYAFTENPAVHKLKLLEPRVDFFPKHPSQVPAGLPENAAVPIFVYTHQGRRMAQKEKIGDFLIGIGSMTAEQRDEVLRLQAEGDRRLFGEIARELGYIDNKAIKKFLGI